MLRSQNEESSFLELWWPKYQVFLREKGEDNEGEFSRPNPRTLSLSLTLTRSPKFKEIRSRPEELISTSGVRIFMVTIKY